MVLKFSSTPGYSLYGFKPESVNFLRKRLLIKVYSVCRLHNFLAFICYHTFMSLYTVFCKITKRIHIFNKNPRQSQFRASLLHIFVTQCPYARNADALGFQKTLPRAGSISNLPAAEPLVIQINLRVPLQDPHWLPFQAPCMQSCRQESSAIPNGIR